MTDPTRSVTGSATGYWSAGGRDEDEPAPAEPGEGDDHWRPQSIRALDAEVTRLRAENERLNAYIDGKVWDTNAADSAAEAERLTVEAAGLRERLAAVEALCDKWATVGSDPRFGHGWWTGLVRAALAASPEVAPEDQR